MSNFDPSEMTSIQLHVAGATVRHSNPFSDIEVPISHEPLSPDLSEKWVKPLYLGLRQPHVEEFLGIWLRLADDELIYQLLSHFNWRTKTAGAYLAVLGGRTAFIEHLGRLLLRSDVCFAGAAYCLALADFGGPESISFIIRYLDHYLTRTDLWFDQQHAMAALVHLDRKEGTNHATQRMPAWTQFISDKPHWNLDRSIFRFEQEIQIVQDLKSLYATVR